MKRSILFFILSFAVHAALSQIIHEQYDYPARPGTVEWKSARNHEELRKLSERWYTSFLRDGFVLNGVDLATLKKDRKLFCNVSHRLTNH